MNKEIQDFFESHQDNVRKDSMRYVYDYLMNNDVKNFIEFGMSRVSGIEGDFTILGSLVAKLKGTKFTSVDFEKPTVDNMFRYFQTTDSELFNSDNGEVLLVHQDQYEFMNEYDGEPFQYVFLDGGDGNKHGAFQCLLDSKMLDSECLICIDDMVAWNPWNDDTYYDQVKEIVRIINEDERLTPVDKVEYSPPNGEQLKWVKYNDEHPIPDNFKVYPNGVKQFDYQILVKYSEVNV